MNLAFLYRRTSTNKQDNSLAAQESLNEEYCRRMGFQVIGCYSDPDVSSRYAFPKREGGSQLLAAVQGYRQANPDAAIHVVVSKQDRLGRDTLDQITTIRKLWEWGVLPHLTIETGPLPRNPSNELLMEVKASVNQHERNQIRERIKTTMGHRRDNGFAVGHPPYGWNKVGTGEFNAVTRREICRFVPNEAEQQWIRQMAEWQAGGWSYCRIATELNARAVPTKVQVGTVRTLKVERDGRRIEAASTGKWKPITVWKVLKKSMLAKGLLAA